MHLRVNLHLDGGHVDFEEWLDQVNAKRPVPWALHQGDLKEVEKVMRNLLPMS